MPIGETSALAGGGPTNGCGFTKDPTQPRQRLLFPIEKGLFDQATRVVDQTRLHRIIQGFCHLLIATKVT